MMERMQIVKCSRACRGQVLGRALLLWLSTAAVLSAQTTIVRPTEIDEILVNPGMGIETFQRFSGQPINEGVKWSEVGPETSTPRCQCGRRLSGFERGVPALVLVADRAGARHLSLVDSRRCTGGRASAWPTACDPDHAVRRQARDARLVLNSGAKRANTAADKDGTIWSPDADDPIYAKSWSALVIEAGKRYDGHPDLNHVDVSTVGYWGEGWGPYLPSWQIQQELIDVYFTAFSRTPLLMNFDALPALQYGVKRGAGWRLDCWGDMGAPGRSFAHMKDFYPQQLARGGLQDAWRTHPVALETCWVPDSGTNGSFR